EPQQLEPPGPLRAQPLPGQNAEQRRADGGNCGQQSFVIAVLVILPEDLAGKIVAVHPSSQVVLLAVIASVGVWRRYEGEQSPVANQDGQQDEYLAPHVCIQVNQGGKQVANRDTLQDAHIALLFGWMKLQEAVIQEPEEEQQRGSTKHTPTRSRT